MLIRSEDKIHINHIMWQPLFSCRYNCHNCYVKESETSREVKVSRQFLDLLKEGKITCNQLTLSLDSTSNPPDSLVKVVDELLNYYRDNGEQCSCKDYKKFSYRGTTRSLPELFITAHDWSTVQQWCQVLNRRTWDFFYPVSVLTLSYIGYRDIFFDNIKEYLKPSKVLLNYNLMATKDFYSSYLSNQEAKELFKDQVKFADQTYLILKKDPLGQEQNPQYLKNWKSIISFLKENLTKEQFQNKIIIDSCISDCLKYNKDKTTCSAGISKIHIWPGDTVSGCPYDSHHKLKSGNSNIERNLFKEIQFALFDRKPKHSMQYCTIPKAVKENDR